MYRSLFVAVALIIAGCSKEADKPLNISAGTVVVCVPEKNSGKINEKPYIDGKPKLSQALTCTVEGNEALPAKTTFVGELAGMLNDDSAPGRAVIIWRELHLRGVTVALNDPDTFESREWYDGNLRVIFKRDLTIQ